MTFAFVNPFSEHKEEACEYLADAWQLVAQGNKIMLSPNESEPVLNSYYEENLKSINNSIADLQKTLDKTEDEEARESLQNDLNSMNEWLTEYEERGKYDVSPEQIEIYRAFGDNMTVQESLIWNMDDGASQIQQYLDGAMNAQQLAGAPDYFSVAMAAIRAMCQAKGAPVYDADGLMQSGTLVRHLILPLRTSESLRILDAIAEELPSGTPVSLMRQYTPMNGVNLPGLDRRLTAREYARVRDYMLALGLEGYLQSRESADSAFTPAFMDGESTRLFPSERADAEKLNFSHFGG